MKPAKLTKANTWNFEVNGEEGGNPVDDMGELCEQIQQLDALIDIADEALGNIDTRKWTRENHQAWALVKAAAVLVATVDEKAKGYMRRIGAIDLRKLKASSPYEQVAPDVKAARR